MEKLSSDLNQIRGAMASQGEGERARLPKVRYDPAKDQPGVFPEPLTVCPQLEHRKTFIVLHSRGLTAETFAPYFLLTNTLSGETLQTAFPYTKLIFLNAPRSRATVFDRCYVYQWFDHWHMEESYRHQDLMRDGLKQSCEYVHGVLKQEIEVVGRENVVLWGVSQGCAASLAVLLTWDGEAFGAVVGVCGYLPFSNHIEDIALFGSGDEDDDKDVLEGGVEQDPPTQAVTFFRNEIGMHDKTGMVFRDVPIFLGHGSADDMVPIVNGRIAKTCLDLLGANVKMVEYEGVRGWHSADMLADILDFLRPPETMEELAATLFDTHPNIGS